MLNLEPIDVAGLNVVTATPDLRRDIHVFVEYVRTREVKRTHRGNLLSKGDAKRLAKLLSEPKVEQDADDDDESPWTWRNFVDKITLNLGFIHYKTEGVYVGYTSREPSYVDNYIEYRAKAYEQFLALSSAKQESKLLDSLLQRGKGSDSEFYRKGILGQLDGFSSWGSAVGVMATLDFTAIRRFLLKLLVACPTGQWLSTASLVDHLKKHHRYFLIPAKPKFMDQRESCPHRYHNFHEGEKAWGNEINIHENDPDVFERVEGRYVERFLEGLPLVMRYVDVAYIRNPARGIHPSRGWLKAFRVSDRLRRALEGKIAEPRVTVTPNFEVHVIAETYPASVLTQLAPLCEMVSEGTSFVLKLTKQKVAATRAVTPDLDAREELQQLCEAPLPANVVHELDAWSQHAEKFTLYSNCSVLEMEQVLPVVDPFTVEHITDQILLVRSPAKLFEELERQALMPMRIKHGERALAPLPKSARTCFPKKVAEREKAREPKPQVKLTRITRVQLVCPNRDLLDKLHRLLLEGQCPAEIDRSNQTLSYSKQYEAAVTEAIKRLKTEYRIEIEDITS